MKQILLFNIPGDKLRKLQVLMIRQHLTWKIVPADAQQKNIGTLLEIPEFPETEPENIESFTEEMMVMAGISGPQMNLLLNGMRQSKAQIALKAMATEKNVQWPACALYQELLSEHNAMKNHQKSIHHPE